MIETERFDYERQRMVRQDLERRGIKDERVLNSMGAVHRDEFVDPDIKAKAYSDQPLPIGCDQTISQPYIVALMTEAAQVKSSDRVLEVGTGSGYSAAVLSNLASEVFTVETIPALAEQAQERLNRLGYANVNVMCGDGSLGWAENAPYDAILVTAAAPRFPESLQAQLAEGGRMVAPVASGIFGETLTCMTKLAGNGFVEEAVGDVCFVPLIGEEGYGENEPWEDRAAELVLLLS